MRKKTVFIGIIAIIFLAVGGYLVNDFAKKTAFPQVTVPPAGTTGLQIQEGYEISVFARGLSAPRVIAFDPQGKMLVSEPGAGRISLVTADGHRPLLEGLDKPHGLAFYTNPKTKQVYLYVAQLREVVRYPYDVAKASVDITQRKSIVNLPAGGLHTTRTIGFGKDFREAPLVAGLPAGSFLSPIKLYVTVGSSCNVCLENNWKNAAILESDPEGKYTAELAGGLRNSVFFAFHPDTGLIWATDMGRDNLGDNLPPDEVNVIKVNAKYGWPYCYGNRLTDKTFKEKTDRTDLPMDCSLTEPPKIEIPAHSAPLGVTFIPKSWGEQGGDLLVAYHGSWNRSIPTGYKVVKYHLDGEAVVGDAVDFITGWLVNNKTIGRPVDLKFDATGSLFISDDQAGVIYKVIKK